LNTQCDPICNNCLPCYASDSNGPTSVARVRDLRDDGEGQLVGGHIRRGRDQFEDEVSGKKWRQKCFSGHEDDYHGSRDPKDHSAANQITQITEDYCTL